MCEKNAFRSIADEEANLRRNFPQVTVSAATPSFLTAFYERTPHARIKLTLTFPDGYPNHPLIVDVANDNVVPVGLKKKLDRELGMVAADASHRHEQVCAVFGRLVSFVDTNRFVPCWRELKQCVALIRDSNDGKSEKGSSTVSTIETKGKIKLKLVGGKYHYSCSVVIDEAYPTTKTHEDWGKACRLTMESTNFPPKIESMLTLQAQEIVRRMQYGMTREDALKMSNPVSLPKHMDDSKEIRKVRLTQEVVKDLKRDTETLKQVSQLREVDAATKQGNAAIKAHSKKERKDARRMVAKITNREITDDFAKEEKEKQWQQEEKARMADISEFDGSNPQPSLLALITFLVQKIQRLPKEQCPVCSDLSLPIDPIVLKSLFDSSSGAKSDSDKKALRRAKLKRPVRTYCGCWYHYKCLNKFTTEPPFGAECPAKGCGRRVYHPDWPGDISTLEREWAHKQARLREIEDAAMFL